VAAGPVWGCTTGRLGSPAALRAWPTRASTENMRFTSTGAWWVDLTLTRKMASGLLLSASPPGQNGLNASSSTSMGRAGSARRTRPIG